MNWGEWSGTGLSEFVRKHGPSGFAGGGFGGATPGGPLAPTGQLGIGAGEQDWLDGVAYVASGVGLVAGAVAVAALAPVAIPAAGAVALVTTGLAAGVLVGVGVVKAAGLDEPPKKKPNDKDLYPDPDGGGGGTPNTIWDGDGGGGTPNTIWDGDGGGGTPNTIWDGDGGGGTPNTIAPQLFSASVLSGPGIKSAVVQLGSATVQF